MIRVLLDARRRGDGGIGSHIEGLIAALAPHPRVRLTTLLRPDDAASLPPFVQTLRDRAPRYSVDEYVGLPRRIPWQHFDLFHEPHYTLPFGVPVPTVVTVHDLIHLSHPSAWYLPIVAGLLIRSTLRRATRVLAVSRATADAIVSFSRRTAPRVRVIPNVVTPRVSTTEVVPLARQFVVALVSTAKPHKGVDDLLFAFERFKRVSSWPGQLLIVGAPIAGRALPEGVQHLGWVSDGMVGRLLRDARAVIVPSLAEGFCYPVAEALALGTPVVARPIGAVRELVSFLDAHGAYLASDLSSGALAEALVDALAAPREAGGRLDRLTPEAIAPALFALYEEIAPRSFVPHKLRREVAA